MKASAARHEIDMTTGPIFKNMVRFAIPLMISSVLQLFYNAADMVVVGRFAGADALAAVGATGAITGLLVNLFMGLSVGANVAVAQHRGAGRHEDASQSVHTSVLLALLGGIVIGILGIVLAKPLLGMMDTPAEILDQAALYMAIYFAGLPFNLLYNFSAAVLRAVGDTKRPLYFLTVAGIINVVLNLIFVILFQMGVAGVALATIISQAVSAVLVTQCLVHAQGDVHLDVRKLRLHKDKVLQIAKVGLPSGLQTSMYSISNTLIQSSINSFGAIAIAGNVATSNIEGFINTPQNAFTQAVMSFVGQNYGARKLDRIKRVTLTGTLIIAVLGLGLGALVLSLGPVLLGIFSSDPAVIDWGMIRMPLTSMTFFIGHIGEVYAASQRATGNPFFPMVSSILGICGFRILWLLTVFVLYPTPTVMYMCYPLSWILVSVIHFSCYLIHMRKVKQELATATV